MMLTVEEITDLESVRILSPQWITLLEKTGNPDIYRTPEWTISWWQTSNTQGKRLYILSIKENAELLGIAPLMEVRDSFLGLPVVKLEFISMWKYTGSAASSLGTMDFIIAERYNEVMVAIVNHIRHRNKEWNFIRLHPFPGTSQSLSALKTIASTNGFIVEEKTVSTTARIYSSANKEGYTAGLSRKIRKTLRESERKLAREGTVEYEEYGSSEYTGSLFSEILDVEKRSWKWKRGITINSTAFRNFYPVLAKETAGKGWLSLWFLKLNGTYIAYGIFFMINRRIEFLKTAYDERFHLCSPGSVLMVHAFEKLFASGGLSINLLAGNTDSKRRWQTIDEHLSELFVFRNTPYSAFLHFLHFTISLYGRFFSFEILFKRILRKLDVHWEKSELTRMDQISEDPWE